MAIKTEIIKSFYQDSVVLMGVAAQIRNRNGVHEAALFTGTAANHTILEQTGLATVESRNAGSDDLILTVDAETEAEAEAALTAARELLLWMSAWSSSASRCVTMSAGESRR